MVVSGTATFAAGLFPVIVAVALWVIVFVAAGVTGLIGVVKRQDWSDLFSIAFTGLMAA